MYMDYVHLLRKNKLANFFSLALESILLIAIPWLWDMDQWQYNSIFICFFCAFRFFYQKNQKIPSEEIFYLTMDIKYPHISPSVYETKNKPSLDWTLSWNQEKNHMIHIMQKKWFYEHALPMVFITMGAFLGYPKDSAVSLFIEKGAVTETAYFDLPSKEPIFLEEENMITIKGEKKQKGFPSISLTSTVDHIPLAPVLSGNLWSLTFSIKDDSHVTINQKLMAQIKVQGPKKPKVQLITLETVQQSEPWFEERLLHLKIIVKSQNPLKKIKLLVETENTKQAETMKTIDSKIQDIDLAYDFSFQPYMEEDLMFITLRAAAIDNALPVPLEGFSPPVTIQVISAYGRYKKSLERLGKIKENLDKEQMPTESEIQSAWTFDNPFYDDRDREELIEMRHDIERPSLDKIQKMDLSEKLSRFLNEHESFDDRQRDRDFFISLKSLGLLKEEKDYKQAILQITKFLAERQKRWTLRVKRLTEGQTVQDLFSKFDEGAVFATQLLKEAKKKEHLYGELAQEYGQWIETLEKQEDLEKEKRDKQRQEGLVDGIKELKALQLQQQEISQALDQASEKPDFITLWPLSRSKQISNVERSEKLLDKIREVSPSSGERLDLATKSMALTKESGDQNQFSTAESASDMASRLLRDAEQKAQSEQSKKDKKAKPSNGYYGRSIHGGNVNMERQYKVDKRYREDLLENIQNTKKMEDQELIQSYLKKIIR